jgi:hypothetical protein
MARYLQQLENRSRSASGITRRIATVAFSLVRVNLKLGLNPTLDIIRVIVVNRPDEVFRDILVPETHPASIALDRRESSVRIS